ncbi:MAG: S41 family peptidase [Bryobacteraceae bacterium]
MSERIYAWLLRLYPSSFREAFGDEALQLYRDRAHYERGFLSSLRLWLDLLGDLAASIPREYARILDRQPLETAPAFHVLADESLRGSALLFGGALSLITFGVLPFLISHSGGYGPARVSSREPLSFADAQPPQRQASAGVDNANAIDRARVIAGAIANLKTYYVYPDVAQKMANALVAHEKSGDHNAATSGGSLASVLTIEMRQVSDDKHLRVVHNQASIPEGPAGPPAAIAQFRKDIQRSNCAFEKIEILPHNIGYLKLNAFPDPSICQSTAAAAMASLNSADAIIFDLRNNGGGTPDMVALVAGYLFDHPTHLTDFYNRAENSTRQSWTHSPIPGSALANKPAYVLTSASTFSGAEEFSYDLKMLKRATLVGETTAGAAHITIPHRIDDHFTIFVPSARPINPVSHTDWEGTGVEPDVKVKAADALATAQKLAESKLRNK